MAELEKVGIPTVSLVARDFVKDWQHSAPVFGVKGLARVVMPRPLVGMHADDVYPLADAAFEELVTMLTESAVTQEVADDETVQAGVIAIEADGEYAALRRMNRMFLDQGWGDGFPLWAPTPEQVDEMLSGTRRARDEVVTVLAPGKGQATVEKIAINAVMAGCQPEHLPLLLAAVEAMSDPQFMMRMCAMSTGAHAPMMIVNGPIAKRLGINSGRCALGPGAPSAVNTVLGRAIRLIMMNVGHTYPGTMDMDTLGSPNKYSMCLAENEEASPWEPYHVEKGFERNANVVTMCHTYAITEVEDGTGTTPEAVLNVACSTASNLGVYSVGWWLMGRTADPEADASALEKQFLIVCPVHAEVFRKYGWSKQDVRDYLYKHARVPFAHLMANKEAECFNASHPHLRWLWGSPDTLMPVLETADCFELVVAGGLGGARSTYSYGVCEPVSRLIEQ